ncbi:hypothetical protein LP416_18655 [Polaromonas sp. P2-4]|nr:hypothetical protein LP416_18655 [Polaromonas sp. P2-4]
MNEAMVVSPLSWFLGPRVLKVHEGPVKQKTKNPENGSPLLVAGVQVIRSIYGGNQQTNFWALVSWLPHA